MPVTQELRDFLISIDFVFSQKTMTGFLFVNKSGDAILLDSEIYSTDFNYKDYTSEQNNLAHQYKRFFRFVPDDSRELIDIISIFLNCNFNEELQRKYGANRSEEHMDPTKPEKEFESAFIDAYGEESLYSLEAEYMYSDFMNTVRYFDFCVKTRKNRIFVELNGEQFHHPRVISPSRYKSQLLKQNSAFSHGIKVFRWSLSGMSDSENFIYEIKRFLGDKENLSTQPVYYAERSTTTIDLMEHQKDILEYIYTLRNAGQNTFLIHMPTGTGKTEIYFEDIYRLWKAKLLNTCLILVPSLAIKNQTIKRLHDKFTEITISSDPSIKTNNIVVHTYQNAFSWFEEYESDYFDYIVIDEAHHSVASGLNRIIKHFTPKTLIGLTATDERLDGKKLSDIFGSYETRLTLKEAIERNILPPIRVFRLETNIDLSEVRYNGKDYIISDLEKFIKVNSRNEVIADLLYKYFGDSTLEKSGIIFCVNIDHCNRMARELKKKGFTAEAVSSEDRVKAEKYIEAYKSGNIQFLCSCSLINEGWDAPMTSVIVMARPTMSKVLYMQQLGRGTRKYPGKEALYVIDIVDQYSHITMNNPWSMHALFNLSKYKAWDTISGNPNETKEMQIIEGLYEYERNLIEIDIFTFQEKYKNYLNTEQLARELFVSTGTVHSWIKKQEVIPDIEIPFGYKKLQYFKPDKIDLIISEKRLEYHSLETQYKDFFNFLDERDYTFSYKIIFILSSLTLINKHGEINIDALIDLYSSFYRSRLENKLTVDKRNCPYNMDFLNDRIAVKKSILSNPFEKFERKKFMHICRDLNYIAFHENLWLQLKSSHHLEELHRRMITDLKKYYSDNNLGEVTENQISSFTVREFS